MKKILAFTLAVMLVATASFAADFAPVLLKLSADPVIQYDFDGSNLEIPVQVSGKPAGIIFCVFTRGKADQIAATQNGYLGWHYVNKVDTCIYYSTVKSVGIGNTTITWDGKDQDGALVPAGEYTYYLWAYDNQSDKLKMTDFMRPYSGNVAFQETDADGLPLANPIYYSNTQRWIVGSDPLDESLLETCNVSVAEGWTYQNVGCLDPHDFQYFYLEVINKESQTGAIQKFKWVPNGDAEVASEWGNEGYSETFTNYLDNEPGVQTDGQYLYTADSNHHKSEPDADFFIVDYEGAVVGSIDLTEWWSDPADQEAGAQMNGGPNELSERNSKVFLNCHCSCIKQMVDPIRFLDTEDPEDFYVWTNQNGDYILDHNFEETAQLPWVCNDFNVGPYTYNLDADDNLFSQCPAYDVGALSFGLMAPDGTGLAYLAFSGETAGWKKGTLFIDSDTPFDGLYCDNEQAGGTHYEGWKANEFTSGTYFIGHDSISGVITNAVAVEDDAPAAFSVAQNSPNPFNPTTTISFSIAEAGNVTIDVYNVAGQKVDTIVNEFMDAGSHSVVWDASDFSAGVYFYTVKSGDFSKTMKMTLLK